MHKTAKGIAASEGWRIDGETHGKIVDFLCCVFPELTSFEKSLVREASTGHNTMSYDDPRKIDRRIRADVIVLAQWLRAAATNSKPVAPARKRIPPPPPGQ